MSSRDYDVFVCCGDSSGADLAAVLAAGLRRRGFRVFDGGSSPIASADAQRLRLIEEIPDFVVVLTPAAIESLAGDAGPLQAEVLQAVRSRRNLVQLRLADKASPRGEGALDGLFSLRGSGVVTYDPARRAESIALVAHRLSSDGTVDERRVMRRSKWLFWAAAGILVVGIALQEIPLLLERWSRPRLLSPVPPFALYWAGVGQRFDNGRWATFPVFEKTTVTSGDQLRFVFSPSADGFAYVVARNARGEVTVLFPTDVVRAASRVQAGRVYSAPVEAGWLTIEDEASVGAIFLIGGYDALQNIEELIEEPEASTTQTARRALLESTVAGLLDGRHGAPERRVWNGKLHPIERTLRVPSGPAAAVVSLASGGSVRAPLAARPGLVSATVEIALEYRAR